MSITVTITEFGVEQPFDPSTGLPWADQATADAWRAATVAAMTATRNAQMGPPPEPDVAALAAAARVSIDEAAGKARMAFITDVPGQGAVYLRKMEQAKAYAAAGFTGAVPPYIAAEADATDVTPRQAAEAVIAIANQWDEVLSPAIEGVRYGSKVKLDKLTGDAFAKANQVSAILSAAHAAFAQIVAQAS